MLANMKTINTKRYEALKALWTSDLTIRGIAKEMDRSASEIMRMAKLAQLPERTHRKRVTKAKESKPRNAPRFCDLVPSVPGFDFCRKTYGVDQKDLERFAALVFTEPNSGCWLYGGTLFDNGRGMFGVSDKWKRKQFLAHRFCYILAKGPVPSGLELDHLCRTPSCVNPAHLEPVTNLENMRRAMPFRRDTKLSHCRKGHPYAGDNIYVSRQGKRYCKACIVMRRVITPKQEKQTGEEGAW